MQKYFYTGIVSSDSDTSKMKEIIQASIKTQQRSFGMTEEEIEGIEIIEYAYVKAEPDCYMVNASWKH